MCVQITYDIYKPYLHNAASSWQLCNPVYISLCKPVCINLYKPAVQITYDIYKPYIHKAASSRELCNPVHINLCKPVCINLYKPVMQITYDIYKPYIHKAASSRELLLVSRVSVAFFGLVMACVSVIFYKVFLLSYQSCICMPACGILRLSHGLCQRHLLQGIARHTPVLHMHVGMLHSIKSVAAVVGDAIVISLKGGGGGEGGSACMRLLSCAKSGTWVLWLTQISLNQSKTAYISHNHAP